MMKHINDIVKHEFDRFDSEKNMSDELLFIRKNFGNFHNFKNREQKKKIEIAKKFSAKYAGTKCSPCINFTVDRICKCGSKDFIEDNDRITCKLCGYSSIKKSKNVINYPNSKNVVNLVSNLNTYNTTPRYMKMPQLMHYLNILLGRTKISVGKDMIEKIWGYMARNNISTEDLTCRILYIIFIREKWKKYTNVIPKAFKMITGRSAVTITAREEQCIREIFKSAIVPIQKYIESHRSSRSSFPSYKYLLMKILEHLGISVPKILLFSTQNVKKMKALDVIWEYVCDYLGNEFKFVASV